MRLAARVSLLGCVLAGCTPPTLSPNNPGGQLVFAESRGASVLTANGVEMFDEARLPEPVVRRSANEPYRPATGFLIPRDGVWRRKSEPVAIEGHGLAVVLRSSDALVPTWGGEVLLRIDVIAPAAAFPAVAGSVRAPRRVAIVLDGRGAEAASLAARLVERLGARDRVALLDSASGGRTVLPILPGSSRTLLAAAAERVLASRPGRADLATALASARRQLRGGERGYDLAVVVLSDGAGVSPGAGTLAAELDLLSRDGATVTAVATSTSTSRKQLAALGDDVHTGDEDALDAAVDAAVPPPGAVALRDLVLDVASVPAPARVLELSGGFAALGIERDQVFLGDLYAGEARTEVARVLLPVWTQEEPLDLVVRARYRDAATGEHLSAEATLSATYSSSASRIAASRHGDVIAYASALAMVRRLHRAFTGSQVDGLGGLRPLVAMQARSMAELARSTGDAALGTQAEVLRTLLQTVGD